MRHIIRMSLGLNCSSLAIALVLFSPNAASCATSSPAHPSEPESRIHNRTPEFMGDCQPNTAGYRKDLRGWRYGDDRDFECFILDEY